MSGLDKQLEQMANQIDRLEKQIDQFAASLSEMNLLQTQFIIDITKEGRSTSERLSRLAEQVQLVMIRAKKLETDRLPELDIYQETARKLNALFNNAELNELVHLIGVDAEEIRGGSRYERCIELVRYMKVRGRFGTLLREAKNKRPNITWANGET